MNERIKELAEQAGFVDKGSNHTAYMSFDHEKFAELILQDCMNQVREQYLPVLEDELMMKDTHWKGYVQCGVDSYVAIKEHFGVEE
jgi:5-formyltetrahydrofolate cyclo-ligase